MKRSKTTVTSLYSMADYQTGEVIRPATRAEYEAALQWAPDGSVAAGIIVAEGRLCYFR